MKEEKQNTIQIQSDDNEIMQILLNRGLNREIAFKIYELIPSSTTSY
jgi:hypothetical protein